MNDPVLVTNPARPRDHGSGFVIRRLDGGVAQVLTCSHVVRSLGAEGIQVAGQPASLVIDLSSEGVDLAVLAVPGLAEPSAFVLACGAVGDEVELLGFEPAGGGPIAVPHRGRITKASLTAIGGHNRAAWQLELADGDIEGGHSGGPVVRVETGQVVGVIAMGPEKQGGNDGVAVAIENLSLWKDAPAIAARPTATSAAAAASAAESSSLLPSMMRPVGARWWWLVVATAGVLAGGIVLGVRAWRSPSSPGAPSQCAIPDVREAYTDAPVEDWCPDALVGDEACVRTFDDGSVITGHCHGTDAIGAWASRDVRGADRWTAELAAAGKHPTAVFTTTTERTVGAGTVTEQHVLTRDVDPAGGAVHASIHDELSCEPSNRRTSAAVLTRDQADAGQQVFDVKLTVSDGVLRCHLASDPASTGVVATSCRIGDQEVTGPRAIAAYSRFLDAEDQLRECIIPKRPSLPACGDGVTSGVEQCDNPGAVESATCDIDCTFPLCGDGLVNHAKGEQCDPGTVGRDSPSCNKDCTLPGCGDHYVNKAAGEACDPGGTATCDGDCTKPLCGDGVVNHAAGEACDPGAAHETDTCNFNCTKRRCGDKIVNAAGGEECDDGRKTKTCTAQCKKVELPTLPDAATSPHPTTPATPAHAATSPVRPAVVPHH
ncbi:MAG TPA: serine protease [Kofleriaceae bacterium]|nr:serine protease [Kofleriaceae bacterium]